MPVCYYLYSLEGALRGKHWDALGESVKRSLLERAKLDARKGRRPATAKR
jgi:DNA transformation protein